MQSKAFALTRNQYNNLLPVLRKNLLARFDKNPALDTFSFIGTQADFDEAMNRCKYVEN